MPFAVAMSSGFGGAVRFTDLWFSILQSMPMSNASGGEKGVCTVYWPEMNLTSLLH